MKVLAVHISYLPSRDQWVHWWVDDKLKPGHEVRTEGDFKRYVFVEKKGVTVQFTGAGCYSVTQRNQP